jgi:hypothetical protein
MTKKTKDEIISVIIVSLAMFVLWTGIILLLKRIP